MLFFVAAYFCPIFGQKSPFDGTVPTNLHKYSHVGKITFHVEIHFSLKTYLGRHNHSGENRRKKWSPRSFWMEEFHATP
jgi:hypothetical protein